MTTKDDILNANQKNTEQRTVYLFINAEAENEKKQTRIYNRKKCLDQMDK